MALASTMACIMTKPRRRRCAAAPSPAAGGPAPMVSITMPAWAAARRWRPRVSLHWVKTAAAPTTAYTISTGSQRFGAATFIGRGGTDTYGLYNHGSFAGLQAACITALGTGGSSNNYGLRNGGTFTTYAAATQSVLEGVTNSVLSQPAPLPHQQFPAGRGGGVWYADLRGRVAGHHLQCQQLPIGGANEHQDTSSGAGAGSATGSGRRGVGAMTASSCAGGTERRGVGFRRR